MIITRPIPFHSIATQGPWTDAEDKMIMECISRGVTKWSEIAERIPGRLGKQVRSGRLIGVLVGVGVGVGVGCGWWWVGRHVVYTLIHTHPYTNSHSAATAG